MSLKLQGAHTTLALGGEHEGKEESLMKGHNLAPMGAGAGKSSGPGFKLKSNMKLDGSKVGASGGGGNKIDSGKKGGK